MINLFPSYLLGPKTHDLLPIVIPTNIVQHPAWIGPSARWNDILSVTWAHFTEPYCTNYLTYKEAEELTFRKKSYSAIALDNLKSKSAERVWSHIKRKDNTIHFLGLSHEDGLGPSRLLLREELSRVFPEGFVFSVPERTCAIVYSRNARGNALESVLAAISGCYAEGREIVSESVFDEDQIRID